MSMTCQNHDLSKLNILGHLHRPLEPHLHIITTIHLAVTSQTLVTFHRQVVSCKVKGRQIH